MAGQSADNQREERGLAGKLFLYTVFHANLNYSYVPSDLYPQILERCYWPLLRIIDDQKIPLGLEFSGLTLETINEIDPSFVSKLSELWEAGLCEVIGCGYVQAVMPLIPSRVNQKNLDIGNETYQRLLGRKPSLAFINEQVYSRGLPDLYRKAGYKGLILTIENALPEGPENELYYRPCEVSLGDDGRTMPVVWHSLDAYRSFQQYIEKEQSLDSFLSGLDSHLPSTGERAYQLYGSDWEVFDFKPWRVQPEGFEQEYLGEMERISELLSTLNARSDLEFITPSVAIAHFPDRTMVQPESPAMPIPYKKQTQHSMTRWAVSGRDNVRTNTQCNQLYQSLQLTDWRLHQKAMPRGLREACSHLWKELCFLWASDFRTFTTEEKYVQFRNRMGAAMAQAERLAEQVMPSGLPTGSVSLTNCTTVAAEAEPTVFIGHANGATNTGHSNYSLSLNGLSTLCQASIEIPGGISGHRTARSLVLELTPSIAQGMTAMATLHPAEQSTDKQNGARWDAGTNTIETPSVKLVLSPEFGGTIQSLTFLEVSSNSLIGSHGERQSGCIEMMDRLGQLFTDNKPAKMEYSDREQMFPIYVPVRCVVQTEMGTVWKTYHVYLNQPRVDLSVRFQFRDIVPSYFRLGRLALNPTAFDRSSLYYATTNGGDVVERFKLQGTQVAQDEATCDGVTARGCLGATEGWTVVADDSVGVGLITRPAGLYSVPLVHYQESGQNFRLSVANSLGEQDETSHIIWRGHSTWSMSIIGGGTDILKKTRNSALLINGGLVAQGATE